MALHDQCRLVWKLIYALNDVSDGYHLGLRAALHRAALEVNERATWRDHAGHIQARSIQNRLQIKKLLWNGLGTCVPTSSRKFQSFSESALLTADNKLWELLHGLIRYDSIAGSKIEQDKKY